MGALSQMSIATWKVYLYVEIWRTAILSAFDKYRTASVRETSTFDWPSSQLGALDQIGLDTRRLASITTPALATLVDLTDGAQLLHLLIILLPLLDSGIPNVLLPLRHQTLVLLNGICDLSLAVGPDLLLFKDLRP